MRKNTQKYFILFIFVTSLILINNGLTLAIDHSGQEYTTPISSHNYHVGVSSDGAYIFKNSWLAQYIKAPKNFYLGKVSIKINNLGYTTDYIKIEIRENTSGALQPTQNSTPALAYQTLVSSYTTYQWQDFYFDEPPKLTGGVTYWICVESTVTPKEQSYCWWMDSGTPNSEVKISVNSGATWPSTIQILTAYYRVYEFYTINNATSTYTLVAGDGATKVKLSPAPLGNSDYYIVINTSPVITGNISAANLKADNSNDSFLFPINDTLREIILYKSNPWSINHDNFSSPVELTIPYSVSAGYVKDSVPPVREETLGICWLDETDEIWVRIPDSTVNKTAKTVSATVNHFSVYTLMGASDTGLSRTYAYPVPFKASDGHSKITFTGLSSQATINIYTVSGELVQSITEDDGDGKNDGLDTDKLSSGVYIYYVYNEYESKKGQLIIIK